MQKANAVYNNVVDSLAVLPSDRLVCIAKHHSLALFALTIITSCAERTSSTYQPKHRRPRLVWNLAESFAF